LLDFALASLPRFSPHFLGSASLELARAAVAIASLQLVSSVFLSLLRPHSPESHGEFCFASASLKLVRGATTNASLQLVSAVFFASASLARVSLQVSQLLGKGRAAFVVTFSKQRIFRFS
jgi:hypothetical protein